MTPVHLYAPDWFWKIPYESREQMKCGPGRGVLEELVPDYFMGFMFWRNLCITPACQIHDGYYQLGPDDCKPEADEVFRNNLIRLVEHRYQEERHPRWLLKHRLKLCQIYFTFVDKFGGPAFWASRNRVQEFRPVLVH